MASTPRTWRPSPFLGGTIKTCTIDGCEKKLIARGLCHMHYSRKKTTGTTDKLDPNRHRLNPVARFWSKVDKTEDCWNWTAQKCPKGYGQINIEGSMVTAHRFSYEMVHGAIPAGIYIDHICLNKSCVNPDHLRQATPKQNAENQTRSGRPTKSGVRGVYWHEQAKKWRGIVGHNGALISVGLHPTIQEAEAAVIAKRLELFTHNALDRVA